jgi:hypothetical protein
MFSVGPEASLGPLLSLTDHFGSNFVVHFSIVPNTLIDVFLTGAHVTVVAQPQGHQQRLSAVLSIIIPSIPKLCSGA